MASIPGRCPSCRSPARRHHRFNRRVNPLVTSGDKKRRDRCQTERWEVLMATVRQSYTHLSAHTTGCLTLLLCQRNNLSMPLPPPGSESAQAYPYQPRIYQTGLGNDVGDSVAVGLTQRWFWDSAQHALASSLLDPDIYMANAEQILTIDLHRGTGIDMHSFVPPAEDKTRPYQPPCCGRSALPTFYGFNPWRYFNTISMV